MKRQRMYLAVWNNGKCPVQQFICGLPNRCREKLLYELQLLENDPGLGPPHVKAIRVSPGLYELRARLGQMIRILFLQAADGTPVLLCGFQKRHDRDLNRGLREAAALRAALASGGAYLQNFERKDYENEEMEPPV